MTILKSIIFIKNNLGKVDDFIGRPRHISYCEERQKDFVFIHDEILF